MLPRRPRRRGRRGTVSLKNNYPTLDWAKVTEYNIERMASHGERRAAEMEEVAATLRELGIDPLMAEVHLKRQREMGEIGKKACAKRWRWSRGEDVARDRQRVRGSLQSAAK